MRWSWSIGLCLILTSVSRAAPSRSGPDAEKVLDKAIEALNEGAYDRCINRADEAFALDPKWTSAWYYRGKCHEGQRSWCDALADYNKFVSLTSDTALKARIDEVWAAIPRLKAECDKDEAAKTKHVETVAAAGKDPMAPCRDAVATEHWTACIAACTVPGLPAQATLEAATCEHELARCSSARARAEVLSEEGGAPAEVRSGAAALLKKIDKDPRCVTTLGPPPKRSNTVAWVFVGSGIAAVAGGGVLLGLAEIDIADHDDLPSSEEDKRENLRRSALEKRVIGGIVGGVGVAVGITGIVMLLSDDDEPNQSWYLGPVIGSGTVGLDLRLRY